MACQTHQTIYHDYCQIIGVNFPQLSALNSNIQAVETKPRSTASAPLTLT